MKYKNILIGINSFNITWTISIKKINKYNIIIYDFDDVNVHNIIISKNIEYIVPLSEKDYLKIKNYEKYDTMILYPNIETVNMLNNKLIFTQFMLNNFKDCIPIVYLLDGIQLLEIKYPVISKPMYSKNGDNMQILFNENDFLLCKNKIIIQQFIENLYEFSAFMMCINGKIINSKIIKYKYDKYTIKKNNFPRDCIIVDDLNIDIFKKIIDNLNYTGGINFDFKYDDTTNKLDIFEINPRFGGSAFSLNFIYDLLCIE
jgi:carbamoylphosphate synthase large subunit